MDDSLIQQRQQRSKHPRIRLTSIVINDNSSITCTVMGTKSKEYLVDILYHENHNDAFVHALCTCPDYVIRGNVCKHLYSVGNNHIGNIDPSKWTPYEIDNFVCRHFHLCEQVVGRNTCCPICFENIDYSTQQTRCCLHGCYNSVHAICWKKYYCTRFCDKCIICRKPLLVNKSEISS